MSERSLHERVASIMSRSQTVGPHAPYAVILEHLRRHFKTESDLLAYLETQEVELKSAGLVPADWKFLDAEKQLH